MHCGDRQIAAVCSLPGLEMMMCAMRINLKKGKIYLDAISDKSQK